MTWGTFGAVDSGVVFFGARLDDCSLALGGSSSNVFGEHSDVVQRSGSNVPAILDALRAADPNSWRDALTVRLLGSRVGDGDAWELDAVEAAVNARSGATQDVEFVARRLLEGVSRTGDRKIVLGSPLYVALAD